MSDSKDRGELADVCGGEISRRTLLLAAIAAPVLAGCKAEKDGSSQPKVPPKETPEISTINILETDQLRPIDLVAKLAVVRVVAVGRRPNDVRETIGQSAVRIGPKTYISTGHSFVADKGALRYHDAKIAGIRKDTNKMDVLGNITKLVSINDGKLDLSLFETDESQPELTTMPLIEGSELAIGEVVRLVSYQPGNLNGGINPITEVRAQAVTTGYVLRRLPIQDRTDVLVGLGPDFPGVPANIVAGGASGGAVVNSRSMVGLIRAHDPNTGSVEGVRSDFSVSIKRNGTELNDGLLAQEVNVQVVTGDMVGLLRKELAPIPRI